MGLRKLLTMPNYSPILQASLIILIDFSSPSAIRTFFRVSYVCIFSHRSFILIVCSIKYLKINIYVHKLKTNLKNPRTRSQSTFFTIAHRVSESRGGLVQNSQPCFKQPASQTKCLFFTKNAKKNE